MKKRMIPCILIIAAVVVLALVSLLLLPDTVTTQFSLGGRTTVMPKPIAVLLPALLGAGGALAWLFDEKSAKGLLLSGIGFVIFALMLIVNL